MLGKPIHKRKMHLINFSQTHFIINDVAKTFISYDDFLNTPSEYGDKVEITHLSLKCECDLIPLTPLISDILVSENFKDVYESAGLEGLEFVPVDTRVIII